MGGFPTGEVDLKRTQSDLGTLQDAFMPHDKPACAILGNRFSPLTGGIEMEYDSARLACGMPSRQPYKWPEALA
jgi:hypothetical protein